MAVVSPHRPSGSSYVSSSPSSSRVSFNCNPEEFFSLPPSPTTGLTTVPLAPLVSTKKIGKNCEDNSDLDYFEFEISQNLEHLSEKQQEEKPQQHGQDSLLMSFADELFCNGQVLPLKLPPRLQFFESAKSINQSSNAASQSLLTKGPFQRWSFRKNESYDFDPFMVAIEHVREEMRGRDMTSPLRRTRSLSPMRTTANWSSGNDSPRVVQNEHQQSIHEQHNLHKRSDNGGPIEPRRSASARPLGCTRTYHERPTRPTPTTLSEPTVKASEPLDIKRGGSCRKELRRLSIKEFLFRSASDGRADSKDKLRPRTAALRKLPPFKNPSFHSNERHCNAKKGVADEESRKKILVPYRTPCVFLCFSFGHKDQMNMN